MTKNHPNLRKTVSTADLYSDPSPPPRHASLTRAFTTVQRPRQNLNPFVQPRANTSQSSLRYYSTAGSRNSNVDSGRRPNYQPLNRHSMADPYSSNLIDLGDDGDEYGTPTEQQSPPPVPPKIPEIPTYEQKREAVKTKERPEKYTKPFTDFMTENPTIFHAVVTVAQDLEKGGYKKVSERDSWDLEQGGKYYVERNGSSLIAFSIGDDYEAGNGAAIVAGHIDALTAKLKPIPTLRTKSGYVQLGVAPYAGGLNNTWWDRDLGIGGRVLVKEHGKVVTKLVKLDWPIARVPTLAPHFGAAAVGPFNPETQMVPIVGIDNSDLGGASKSEEGDWKAGMLGGEKSFAATQPEGLVKVISEELGISDCKSAHS
jgi:aminopeptidase I